MGTYIHRGNGDFIRVRNSEYIDKSGLINVVNATLNTEHCFSCVTRSRRFGKSMAAKMLCAYYDCSCDSKALFSDLEIAQSPSFEEHLNKYNVLYLDMTDFITRFRKEEYIIDHIQEEVKNECIKEFPDVETNATDDLMAFLIRVVERTHTKFFMIIDEWDAICREFDPHTKEMDAYVNWMRRMFKSVSANSVFSGVYLTGILPIKKYKTESALNNFWEYSMVSPSRMAKYFGFTRGEVEVLCKKYHTDFNELTKWYDGYRIGDEPSMFNPNSVIMAVFSGKCRSYWSATGAYDQVATYIAMNYDGLKDDIIYMLSGGRCSVDTSGFANDMSIIKNKDDVFTVLIHLGYLAYDWDEEECYIPNTEVRKEIAHAIRDNNWKIVSDAVNASKQLLQSTLMGDAEAVAKGIEMVHDENTSILSYNNENSLSCVLSLAYIYARNHYIFHRELATGKGFADLVLIPRKNEDKPALILELKCNQEADTAIDQIKRKQYTSKVAEYSGEILLIGINYNKETKTHTCKIEKIIK